MRKALSREGIYSCRKFEAIAACGIAVMAKASTPGRTKTRLVPPLSFEEAAQFNTAFLCDVAENILAASEQSPIAGYMAFGPSGSEHFFQNILPHAIGLIEAWHPNFGDCLYSAIARLFTLGHANAVVLNSDSPTLPTALLVETADVLARPGERIVLGPAADGGYYLLGMKEAHRRLFEDVAWSTEHVAEQTRARADELGLPVHILPTWYDVDDVRALRMLQAELAGNASFAMDLSPNRPRHTRMLMQSLMERSDLQDRLALNAFRRAAE
jgi:rSAM/selenodomain-associated transferase 1